MSDDHDAVLRVLDFDSLRGGSTGPSGKDVGWRWADGRPTLSSETHDELEDLVDETHERTDVEALEHGDVVAQLWVDENESVDRIEWQV